MPRSFLFAALLCVLPTYAVAQEQTCAVDTGGGRAEGINEGGVPFVLIHDPFTATCSDGVIIRANSGRVNQATREVYLFGDVYFEDSSRTLTAREATYNAQIAHLVARNDVVYVDRVENMSLRGPDLEYFRATEERPVAQMSATQRPVITLSRQGSAGEEPTEMVSDRVTMLGEDDLSAFGSVVITRSDMRATSGEARYNSTTGDLELRQDALIESQEYQLRGEVVQARLVDNVLEHLRARSDATLLGEDLTVSGEELQLFFEAEQLQRAVATAPSDGERRAEASSPGFVMVADSLDANFVEERLREVHAIGNARGETIDTASAPVVADTVGAAVPVPNEPILSDWVSGDTIVGYFAPRASAPAAMDSVGAVVPEGPPATSPPGDGSTSVDLERLVAIGGAQSLYRMRPEGEPQGDRRNLNYLIGDRIELEMANGELEVAEVAGLQYGVYLEATSTGPGTPSQPAPIAPTPGTDIPPQQPLGGAGVD